VASSIQPDFVQSKPRSENIGEDSQRNHRLGPDCPTIRQSQDKSLLLHNASVGKMSWSSATFVASLPVLVRGSEFNVELAEDATSYNVVQAGVGSRQHVRRIPAAASSGSPQRAKSPTVGTGI
jgi:hypothetical protein